MVHSSTLLALVATAAAASTVSGRLHEDSYYESKFQEWLSHYGMGFVGEEFGTRFANFVAAEDYIESHNQAGHSYKLAHNAFSHMSFAEFRVAMGLDNPISADLVYADRTTIVHKAVVGEDLPDSVDWVAAGAVVEVKDQGFCGGCWAFSTTGALEGAYAIKYGELLSFSEQQLISCDTVGNMGCSGGVMDWAFRWVNSNGGLCTEEDYPFDSSDGVESECLTSCTLNLNAAPVSYVDVDRTEDDLKSAVAQQPVSIGIEADQLSFMFYSEGVFSESCGTELDHGVLLVGYGTYTDGMDYWKVKNSWGESWGMDGYILLERNIDTQRFGQCGLTMMASYPLL